MRDKMWLILQSGFFFIFSHIQPHFTAPPAYSKCCFYLYVFALLSSRYSIHLWDLNHPGTWESKGTYVYYTDFIMELAMLFLDLMHHIHMLVGPREQRPLLADTGRIV